MDIDNIQIVNLADHVNAAIDKINENFELTRGEFYNLENYFDSDVFIKIGDNISQYYSNINLGDSTTVVIDSNQILEIFANTGIESRLDSVEGGFSSVLQQFTLLEQTYTNSLDSAVATSTAFTNLSTQISNINGVLTSQAQQITDLNSTIVGNISIDSDMIVQAVGGALTDLSTTVQLTDSSVNVLSQQLTDLNSQIELLDSDLNVKLALNSSAIETLTSTTSLNSSGLSALSQSVSTLSVSLENFIQNGIEVTPEQVIAALGDATSDIYTRLNANSEAISVVSEDISTLNTYLAILDSAGALTEITSNAISSLRSEVKAADSGLIQAISSLNTTLTNKIDSDIQTAVNTISNNYVSNGDLTNAIQAARTAISQEIDSDIQTAVNSISNSYVSDGELTNAIQAAKTAISQEIDGDVQTAVNTISNNYVSNGSLTTALQTARTSISQEIDSNITSAVSTLQNSIDELGNATSQYALELNANNYITGIYLSTNGSRSNFSVVTDEFNLVPSTSSGERMSMSASSIKIYDAGNKLRVQLGKL